MVPCNEMQLDEIWVRGGARRLMLLVEYFLEKIVD